MRLSTDVRHDHLALAQWAALVDREPLIEALSMLRMAALKNA